MLYAHWLVCCMCDIYSICQIFERETKREKILEGRRREMKLKAKQAAASGGGGGGGGGGEEKGGG